MFHDMTNFWPWSNLRVLIYLLMLPSTDIASISWIDIFYSPILNGTKLMRFLFVFTADNYEIFFFFCVVAVISQHDPAVSQTQPQTYILHSMSKLFHEYKKPKFWKIDSSAQTAINKCVILKNIIIAVCCFFCFNFKVLMFISYALMFYTLSPKNTTLLKHHHRILYRIKEESKKSINFFILWKLKAFSNF